MKKYENQLMKHILNEKYLGEEEERKMTKEELKDLYVKPTGENKKLIIMKELK